jgi:plasmid stabilization system protein ParE
MKVHWTHNAIESLANIYAHVAINSPVYARGMVDKITRRSVQIADHPFSGRRVPEYDNDDIREIIQKPYRIIYRVKANQIDVLAIIHGAQLLTDTM